MTVHTPLDPSTLVSRIYDLEALIDRVRDLHRPVEGYWTTYCEECSDYSEVLYPCETIAALGATK